MCAERTLYHRHTRMHNTMLIFSARHRCRELFFGLQFGDAEYFAIIDKECASAGDLQFHVAVPVHLDTSISISDIHADGGGHHHNDHDN